MKKTWMNYLMTGTLSAVAGLGAAAAVAIPIILKEKRALNNFIPDNHKWKNKAAKAKSEGLKYISLGDSEAAGYDGYMGTDYLSYADFFANDMKKANILSDYQNFSVTGAMISGVHDLINRNPGIMNDLKDSDVITITIGANDLLRYVRILDAQFGLNFASILGLSPIKDNEGRSGIDPNHDPNSPVTPNQRWGLINNSLIDGAKMFSSNNFAGALNLQPELVDVVYKLIERDMITLLADIGKIAPNADVIVTAHAYPFLNLPDSLKNGIVKDNGMSLTQGYARFVKALRDATSYAHYAKFQDINEIPEYKNDNTARPGGPTNKNDPMFRYRKMPNLADIHPSTYGHELIGNGLFHIESKSLFGLAGDWKDYYTKSTAPIENDPTPHPENFERFDEGQYAKTTTDTIARELIKGNDSRNMLSQLFTIFGGDTKKIPDYNDPNDTKNNTVFKVKYDTSGKTLTATPQGPYVPKTPESLVLLRSLFGPTFTPGATLLETFMKVEKDPNLSKALSLVGILVTQVAEQGENKDGAKISPEDYIKKMITNYTKPGGPLMTEAQYATADTYLNTNYQTSKLVSYQDPGTDFKTNFGVKNFGEFLTKYNATTTFMTLQKMLPMAAMFAAPALSPAISQNNGEDFLSEINRMGAGSISTKMTAAMNKSRSDAKKDTENQTKFTTDGKNFYNAINSLNVSLNVVDKTNITEPKNDVWNQLGEKSRIAVNKYFEASITKISSNEAEWTKFTKKLKIEPDLTKVKALFDKWNKEFIGMPILTKKGLNTELSSTVRDMVLAKHLTNNMDEPIDLIAGSLLKIASWVKYY